MLDKIKSFKNSPNFKQLQDTRALGLILFGLIAVMVTWSGVKAVQTNYALQKEISRLQQENEVKKLENTNLGLKNQYYNSDQYLELAARQSFGKAAPGETVVLIPRDVALAHTIEPSKKPEKPAAGQKPKYQQNFEDWIDFFLQRTD